MDTECFVCGIDWIYTWYGIDWIYTWYGIDWIYTW
jgi:hypothetical protein